MKKRDLERALEEIPDFPNPDPSWEQYPTPPGIAAALLWEANLDGALNGKRVLDLGCGTGILSKGAELMGATVIGVDQDESALGIARQYCDGEFRHEILPFDPPQVDTVIMNPPFGAQKKGADRVFFETAAAAKPRSLWFLQQPKNQKFLAAFGRELGGELEKVGEWDYPITARFDFHLESIGGMRVGGYVLNF